MLHSSASRLHRSLYPSSSSSSSPQSNHSLSLRRNLRDGFDIPFTPLSLSICRHVCARQVKNEAWNVFPKCFFWKEQTTAPL
ncbi:hypothetical protein LXL04_023923, partial [Taraxacum kok-saghyz]